MNDQESSPRVSRAQTPHSPPLYLFFKDSRSAFTAQLKLLSGNQRSFIVSELGPRLKLFISLIAPSIAGLVQYFVVLVILPFIAF